MDDDESNRAFLRAQKLDEYKNQLLESIRRTSPLVKESLDQRDKEKTQEVLVSYFVEGVEILTNIAILLGKEGKQFTPQELSAMKANLINLMKHT